MKTTLLSSESLVLGSVLDLRVCKVQVNSRKDQMPPGIWSQQFGHSYEVETSKSPDLVCAEVYEPCKLDEAVLVILEHHTCPMGFKRLMIESSSLQFQRLP